ncbi:hypothetical protein ES708_22884 [subsurface metagenome]
MSSATEPMRTVWLAMAIANSASICLATAPAITLATVSRALALSEMFLISSCPYFMAPARSAWPGRGVVILGAGFFVSSRLIASRQLAKSRFLTIRAMGLPSVWP